MASRPRDNGPVSIYNSAFMHLHVDIQIALVFGKVPALPTRDAHEENKVSALIGQQDFDFGTAVESPSPRKLVDRLGFKEHFVHDCSICRRVFYHENAVLVEVNAEVDIAEARVWFQTDIAAARVPTECKALRRYLDLGGEPQGNMMFPHILLYVAKVVGVIFLLVVQVELIGVMSCQQMVRVFFRDLSQPLTGTV